MMRGWRFFLQAEDGIRARNVTGVQTCALPISSLRDPALRYADVRVTVTSEQHVRVRNGEVDTLAATVDRAAGVRVLVGNGWGFAATSDVSEGSIRTAARRALEVAAASHIAA